VSDTSIQTSSADPEDRDPNIRQLRDTAKRYDESEAALQAAHQRIAILESGLDLESPVGELFMKGYAGEYTPDALKDEAARYGVPMKDNPTAIAEEAQGVAELVEDYIEPTGTAERRLLAIGAPADTGENKDPRQLALEHFNRRMAEGATEDVAAAEHVAMLANAAIRGDHRVIYKER
jgi:hypothetical protein